MRGVFVLDGIQPGAGVVVASHDSTQASAFSESVSCQESPEQAVAPAKAGVQLLDFTGFRLSPK
jgi:hypothetical protein